MDVVIHVERVDVEVVILDATNTLRQEKILAREKKKCYSRRVVIFYI